MIAMRYYMVGSLLLILTGCWQSVDTESIIAEAYMIHADQSDDVDSVALWRGPEGQHWLLATAKGSNRVFVYDAVDGSLIKTFGQQGDALGQFNRPNGIAVIDNLVAVVERDGKRLQLFHLPTLQPCIATQEKLERPYGIATVTVEPGVHDLYVTDNPGHKGETTAKKIHQYRLQVASADCSLQFIRTFGDESGDGALWKVESIVADPIYNRLFIADEHPAHKHIKIYTLDGIFTGVIMGAGLIQSEPEGIAIYPTDKQHGYIIATDQDKQENRFWVFDRVTLAPLGSFMGKKVRNTDGIAITHHPLGSFNRGALYAVDDDGGIGVYDWQTVMHKLKLGI